MGSRSPCGKGKEAWKNFVRIVKYRNITLIRCGLYQITLAFCCNYILQQRHCKAFLKLTLTCKNIVMESEQKLLAIAKTARRFIYSSEFIGIIKLLDI